ncbi:MAG: rubredoxin [Monoraphidium minutum]|nr:MAG: rubredoxin [Monoraphidium minutum]
MQAASRVGSAAVVRPAVVSRARQVQAQALFGFGAKKEEAGAAPKDPFDKKTSLWQFYICVDCGFIYDGDFSKAPGSYKCPICKAPKSRFKVYKGAVKGKPNNTGAAMKQRFGAKQW